MARHLEREDSAVAMFRPHIYAQGSFQLGTVVPPHDPKHGYDLDLACEMRGLTKQDATPKRLKQLVGDEVKAYAQKHGMRNPEEKPRCWHLDYQDPSTHFHEDVVPCVPEDDEAMRRLTRLVAPENAAMVGSAVAITDWIDVGSKEVSPDWRSSNPMGYAEWFKSRMRSVAGPLLKARAELREVEQVPVYEWKTPLQAAVQILKQHRNAMFRNDPGEAPPSCIITTLAALAYDGQLDLHEALVKIVEGMPGLIQRSAPFVPNPVDPEEDFADKWISNPARYTNYKAWYTQLVSDLEQLGAPMTAGEITEQFDQKFGVPLRSDQAKVLATKVSMPAAVATPTLVIPSRPEPWAALG